MSASVFPVPLSGIQETLIAAKGDLIVGLGNDNPGILTAGTTNQVLTVDSSTTSGLKWAAASSGAMTFITKNTFSNVANVAINDIFSSSYDNYQVYIEIAPATSSDDVILQVNYSGTIETLNCYYGACFKAYTTTGQTTTTGTNQFTLMDETGWVMLNFQNVGNTGEKPQWHGTGVSNNSVVCLVGGYTTETKTITGINLKSSSSNITGFVTVYGLAKS